MGETREGPPPAHPDEVNRLWAHGMHEERLFHDRLNYFSFLEMGLLTICGIMYNKESAIGFFLPITVVGMLFTFLWFVIQRRHWAYCVHVNDRIKQLVPEYKATLEACAGKRGGLSISAPLALSVPALFALTWVAFLTWILFRDRPAPTADGLTVERVILVLLAGAVGWLVYRIRHLERAVRSLRQTRT
ncbi:hypothetical protein R5W24_005308 [Gemmata sp. JC717]|uniref:RipA family octameric membrane protein n=1 Tax=Gemmata algarum TaxID=2975278 RepID=UPI0021BAB6FD|nr:hypothetical protein [Gemmata algarum]MDY3556145.1 hypothetical protein [Gemmata algarum]